MKKILTILILLSLLASSCRDNVTISKEEYQKLKGDTLRSEYPKPFKLYTEGLSWENSEGIVLGSDKHEYLVIWYGSHSCNIDHYIDCKLCKGKESLINQ